MAKAGREPTASADQPLLHLCTLWHRQNLLIEACGADDELSDRRADALALTEQQIARTKAETAAGLFAKLAIYEHHLFVTLGDPENLYTRERLALSLIGDVRRILIEGGATS